MGFTLFWFFFSVMDHDFCLGPPIETTQKQTIMSCTWGISYLKVFWTSDMIDYLVLTSNRQHGHWKISSRPDKSDKATTHSRNVESFWLKPSVIRHFLTLIACSFGTSFTRGGGGGGAPGDFWGGGGGGRGYSWEFLVGSVPPSSPNPDPISDQIMSFSRPVFRPDL